MPLDMQFGDLATRIARAFRVRGRIPLKLDEMVVPVSVVQSIDQDPFRTEPITWTAVAGSTVAPLPAPPLGQVQMVAVRCVSGVVLVSAYSSQVGALGQVTISRNTGLGAFVPPVPGFVTALNRDAPGVVAAAAPALQLLIDSQPVLPIGQPIYQPVASEQFTRFPDPVVLFPGDFFILSGPTDESIGSATFFGQEFPPLT